MNTGVWADAVVKAVDSGSVRWRFISSILALSFIGCAFSGKVVNRLYISYFLSGHNSLLSHGVVVDKIMHTTAYLTVR